MSDGTYFDKNGYFYDQDGYDEQGGWYDQDGKYVLGEEDDYEQQQQHYEDDEEERKFAYTDFDSSSKGLSKNYYHANNKQPVFKSKKELIKLTKEVIG